MNEEKNKSTSKKRKGKQKEVKLTAAERRRLQREQERGEETRFSAFETAPRENRNPMPSRTDQSRFSAFDESADSLEEKDDYFDRFYGMDSSDGRRDNHQNKNRSSRRENIPEKKSEEKSSPEKNVKAKELTKKQRKVRTTFSYVGVFLVIVVIAVVLSLTVMFKTTEIQVKGDNIPYAEEEIIKTSGLKYSENIFMAKRKAAVKNIVDRYPYIENAQVTFRIPGTQIITVETAVPSYQVAVNDGFAVVSAKGRVLEISASQRGNIPLLKGLKLTDSREGQYISFEKSTTQQILDEVINNINENNVPNIYGIDISNSASIKLNYDNRITILLGMPEDVGYKLRTAMAIINNELAATDKGDLDVSLASSDRKSSYFTPVYTNTVNIDGGSKTTSSASSSDDSSEGSTTVRGADEYLNGNSSGTASGSQSDDYDYINDIIDENYDYEYDEPQSSQAEKVPNIISDYGEN